MWPTRTRFDDWCGPAACEDCWGSGRVPRAIWGAWTGGTWGADGGGEPGSAPRKVCVKACPRCNGSGVIGPHRLRIPRERFEVAQELWTVGAGLRVDLAALDDPAERVPWAPPPLTSHLGNERRPWRPEPPMARPASPPVDDEPEVDPEALRAAFQRALALRGIRSPDARPKTLSERRAIGRARRERERERAALTLQEQQHG